MSSIDLGTARGKIEIDASGASRAYKETAREHQGFMGKLDQSSAGLDKAGKALVGVGAAALGGLGLAVNKAATFEQAMNRVGAVSGATGQEFESLKELAKDLGATTAFSASEAADGMQFLAMAGFETNEILDAMPGTLDLAAAGQLDLARAADIASNVLTGYGMEASDINRVNDVMASTASKANTDINQLGDAMGYVAPVAAASGLQFEETSAAIGALSDAGIQGTRAGTTLRQVIARLENPSAKAEKAIERLGISTHDSSGQLLPMVELVEQMEDAGLSTADAMEIFGARAGPGMMALVSQGSDSIRDLTGELENSGGAAKEMADRQLEGLNGALTEMRSAIEGAMISIGENLLPHLERFADILSSLIRRFTGLPGPVQAFIAIGGALFGVLTLLSGVLLLILSRLPMMVQGIRMMGGALSAIHAGPIGLILVALAALAAGLIYLWKNNETFREIVTNVWERVQEVLSAAADFISGIFDTIEAALSLFINGWKHGFNETGKTAEGWQNTIQKIGDAVRKIISGIRSFIENVLTKIRRFWDKNGENIMRIVKTVFNVIKTTIEVVLGIIWGIIKTVLSMIQGFWDRFGNTILTYVKNTFSNIRQFIKGVLDVILGIVQFFISLFTGDWSGMADALGQIWSGLWNMIAALVKQVINAIAAIISAGVNAVIGLWNTLRDRTSSAWNKLVEGVKRIVRNLIDYVKELPGRIIDAFEKLPGQMKDVGKDIIDGMIEGVKEMAGKAVQAAKDLASDVKDQVTGFFKIGSPSRAMMEDGEDIVRGLTIGLENMTGDAVRSALKMAESVAGAMPSPDVVAAADANRTVAAGAQSRRTGGRETRTVNAEGRVDMTVINPDNAELERATRRALRTTATQWEVD